MIGSVSNEEGIGCTRLIRESCNRIYDCRTEDDSDDIGREDMGKGCQQEAVLLQLMDFL